MDRLYSNLKVLAQTDRLDAIRRGETCAPAHVRIKPINRCNHNCWYCAYRADQLQLGENMNLSDRLSDDKLLELVDDLVAMGVKAVTFSGGGEPLLHKRLPDAVERLARGGVRVATLTNGSNLKGRMADTFAEYGTWIRVSMDAWDDASYAQARGVREGEFSRIIDCMRAFVDRRSRCVLGVSFIISHDNHMHIYDVCALLKDVGVNHVKLAAAVVSNDVCENNRYHREIMATVASAIERARALSDDGFTVLDHYHETAERFRKSYRTCPFARLLTVVGADAKVYTCQDKAYTEAGLLGSIEKRSFREFWYSDDNQRQHEALDPSRHCQHHCVAHEKNLALADYLSLDPAHADFV
jgi:MoaA/NifB/PqqE/SkfB family radical SAM enzyme